MADKASLSLIQRLSDYEWHHGRSDDTAVVREAIAVLMQIPAPLVWSSEPTKPGRWLVEFTGKDGVAEEYVQTLAEDEIGLSWVGRFRFAFIPEPMESGGDDGR